MAEADESFTAVHPVDGKLSKLSQRATPLERIQLQCDAVEELIESRATELSDDAPITQWRDELSKIRRGTKLISKASVSDRKKIKELQQRSKKLLDSAFNAAIN